MNYKNKTIWITGASSGIGEALSLAFAKENARLILSSRTEDKLERVKKQCIKLGVDEVDILVLPFDILDLDCHQMMVDKVIKKFNSIDVLINNAGVSQRATAMNMTMDTYRRIIEIDFFAPTSLIKAVLPHMIKQHSGHLITTSSVAGKIGAPARTGYCAAKHAVLGFNDALRPEVHDSNIAVSTIIPGFVKTNISKNALTGAGESFGKTDADIRSGMSPEQASKIIIEGIKKQKTDIVVAKGNELIALYLKRFLPSLLRKMTVKFYQKRAHEYK